jgi:hypothetical protein
MLDPKLVKDLRKFFDAEWYLAHNPDVRSAGIDPLTHYVSFGANEGRDPNRYFDGNWYIHQNRDVAEAGLNPLLHYLQFGAAEHRSPHPRFNVAWYVEQHPEASANPLLYHILVGAAQGWPTERDVAIADYLPSDVQPPGCPEGLAVDVIIPVYRGLAETRRAIGSVLDDPQCLPGRVIVIDDCSPEPKLGRWLDQMAAQGRAGTTWRC